MKSSDEVQQLADLSVTNWANACTDAVHRVDPQALVSASVFTFGAVFRSGPGHAWSDKSSDPRLPMDPAVLARTRLSFVDIHLYPRMPDSLDRDLKSLDWENLKRTCQSLGKPLIMGEFGVRNSRPMTVPEVAVYLRQHVQRVLNLGFQGYLMWHYDCVEEKANHTARDGADEIFRALAGLSPQTAGPNAFTTTPPDADQTATLVRGEIHVASLLGKPLSTVEAVLGKPRYVGPDKERYYKVQGFVRVIVDAPTTSRVTSITFLFPRSGVKSWPQACLRVGLAPSGAARTDRMGGGLNPVPGLPGGWKAAWIAPSDAADNALRFYDSHGSH